MNDPFAGPGEALRAAREELQYSCREVAEALNLHVDTVVAIEANDYGRLPAPAYTRGYIRAYAKLLELDADALVADYRPEEGAADGGQGSRRDSGNPRRLFAAPLYWLVGLLAVGALVALVGWFWSGTGEGSDGSRPETPPPSGPAVIEPPLPAETAMPMEDEVRARDAEGSSDAAHVSAEPQGEVAVRNSPPEAVALEPRVVPQTGPASVGDGLPVATTPPAQGRRIGPLRITAEGQDRLRFQFVDDCWVEVKSAQGAMLYSDLNRRGGELELIGEAPFRILLGYAPGAELWFNDESVALAPHTRNSVANLVLGQYQ